MAERKETITVHVNVEITPQALMNIVENAKSIAGRNEKGVYIVDTADKTGEMISRFLLEKKFEEFTKNIDNYVS